VDNDGEQGEEESSRQRKKAYPKKKKKEKHRRKHPEHESGENSGKKMETTERWVEGRTRKERD
jgi:hypothetical protein